MSSLNNNNDTKHTRSLSLLSASLSKDYFEYKMNIQNNVYINKGRISQSTIEFLCDLIDKQYIYIQELESKYKALKEDFSYRKMIIENKTNCLKEISDNALNRFIKKNYEQEQKIIELEKANAVLIKTSPIKYRCVTPTKNNNLNKESVLSSSSIRKSLLGEVKQVTKTKSSRPKNKKAVNVYLHKENLRKFETITNNSLITVSTTSTSGIISNTINKK